MICIFNKNETVFTYNGLAVLEPSECIFKPSINGVWSLEMTVPYDSDGKYLEIENEKILKITGIDCIAEQTASYQLFRIYDHKKQDDSVYVLAYPIGLDARFDTFNEEVRIFNKTAAEALSQINGLSNKYTVTGSGYNNDQKSTAFRDTNIIQILNGGESDVDGATYKSFIETWDGEICYDNYNIRVNHRLGSNLNPLDVTYGKNIMGMSYDVDNSNVITRLYPKAKSGEYLNAVQAYKISNNRYVDAPNASDYNYLPHEYSVEAPYNLVQTTNDGSAEYAATMALYNEIKEQTMGWLYTVLQEDDDYDGLLNEIELDWITKMYGLTMAKDQVSGIVEHMCNNLCSGNIVASSVKSLIYSAMKAGFDEVLTSDGSRYIGSSSKKFWSDMPSDRRFYSYTWDSTGEYRDRNGTDYIWIYASSKWIQLNSNGYATGAEDKTKWKWYKKKSSDSYKRYGNKSKNRYLHNQWWKINDVWYWFDDNGKGKKGNSLLTMYLPYFDGASYGTLGTLYEELTPIITGSSKGEPRLFNLLYTQMTNYCTNLFATEGLSYPVPKIEINIVDLSQTTEYAAYQNLEKIKLGNTVNVTNPKIGVNPKELRVTGLTYDVLRKCNTEIQIGVTESTVINLLDSIGKNGSGDRIISGSSTTEVSSTGVQDVILDGETCVYGGVAYIDLNLEDIGLQWFEETENALYGARDETYLIDDVNYKLNTGVTINGYYYRNDAIVEGYSIQTSLTGDADASAMYFPLAYGTRSSKILRTPDRTNNGFIFVLSKSLNVNINTTVVNESNPNNNDYYFYSLADGDYNTHYYPTQYRYNASTGEYQATGGVGQQVIKGYVTIDGVTWYGALISHLNQGYYSTYNRSLAEYLPVADFPAPATNIAFENMAELITYMIPLKKDTDGHGVYNGISREGNLAFFAGADDEHGLNAPIKIFTDGTYQGLDKVEDVQLDGQSLVDDNKIAHVDDAVKVKDVKYGNTSLVTDKIAQLDSLQEKLTVGDNIQISNENVISATDTTYNDFDGSAHGLVPKPTGASSGRYLKEDGTWEVPSGGGGGSSDLDAVELTKAQYDALTPEQKADTDKIYFVEDYNPPSGGNVYTAGYGIDIDANNKISLDRYKQGDTVSVTDYYVPCIVSNDSRKIEFKLQLAKKIEDFVQSSTCNSATVRIYDSSTDSIVDIPIYNSGWQSGVTADISRDFARGIIYVTLEVASPYPSWVSYVSDGAMVLASAGANITL